MWNHSILLLLSTMLVSAIPCLALAAGDDLTGPYLGQAPPGDEPELFAPGIISDGLNNRDIAMTPDGAEFYYAINMRNFAISTIMVVRRVDGRWGKPEVADFAADRNFKYLEPAISPDGSKFFFVSSKSDDSNNDIWVMDREGSGWGTPRKLGAHINTAVSETFPSITRDGTLYFSRAGEDPRIEHIYRSRWVNGSYARAEKLPLNVNSGQTQFNAFVDANERYLIVSVYGRDDSLGSIDYYVVYRNEKDEWSGPVNMGEKINTAGAQEYSAYVSRDGKYLFFMSTRTPGNGEMSDESWSFEQLNTIHNSPENGNSDIYWMDSGIIEALRPQGY